MTRQQALLLAFIERRSLEQRGVSPSFDEMKDALGLKSKSGIHRLITGLAERGYIIRHPHRARSIEIARKPDNAAQRLVELVNMLAATEGQARTAAALLELAERVMPKAEAA